jgi:hypothetical protein
MLGLSFFFRIYNPYLSLRQSLYTLTQMAAASYLMSFFLERQSAYSTYDDYDKFSTACCIPVIIFLVRKREQIVFTVSIGALDSKYLPSMFRRSKKMGENEDSSWNRYLW